MIETAVITLAMTNLLEEFGDSLLERAVAREKSQLI
jgi:hypothetical protein